MLSLSYLPKVLRVGTLQTEIKWSHDLLCFGESSLPSSSSMGWGRSMISFSAVSSVSSLRYSIAVRRTTSAKGTSWQKTSQMSIILMFEVGGRLSILLMKMVVITSMVVKLTLKAASKKKGLKKVVAKVIVIRRRVGK